MGDQRRCTCVCLIVLATVFHIASPQSTFTPSATPSATTSAVSSTNKFCECPANTSACEEHIDEASASLYLCCGAVICCNDTSTCNVTSDICESPCLINNTSTSLSLSSTTNFLTTSSPPWYETFYLYIAVGGGGLLILIIVVVVGVCCCKRKGKCCFRRQPDRLPDELPSKHDVAKPGVINKNQKKSKPNDYTKPATAQPTQIDHVVYESTEMLPTGNAENAVQEDYENVPAVEEIYENNGMMEAQPDVETEQTEVVYGNIGVGMNSAAAPAPEEVYCPMDQNDYQEQQEQMYQPPQMAETSTTNPVSINDELVGALRHITEDYYRNRVEDSGPPVAERGEEAYSDVSSPQPNQFLSRDSNQTYYADTNTGQTGEEYADAPRFSDDVIYENVNR